MSYIGEASGVSVNLDTGFGSGAAAGDSYANVEEVYGTRYDDVINGRWRGQPSERRQWK